MGGINSTHRKVKNVYILIGKPQEKRSPGGLRRRLKGNKQNLKVNGMCRRKLNSTDSGYRIGSRGGKTLLSKKGGNFLGLVSINFEWRLYHEVQ
jgi:hypothetical protein